jgi:hypothetical protein
MIRIEGTNFKLVVVGSPAVGVPISLMFLIIGVSCSPVLVSISFSLSFSFYISSHEFCNIATKLSKVTTWVCNFSTPFNP